MDEIRFLKRDLVVYVEGELKALNTLTEVSKDYGGGLSSTPVSRSGEDP